jgi:hypothetical protein
MKKIVMPFAVACVTTMTFVACKKDAKTSSQNEAVSEATMTQIKALGFSTQDVHKTNEGYLVEGDILLTPEVLNSSADQKLLRIADNEQYRTTNLVSGLPRTITVLVSKLGSAYVAGTDTAIARYNALNGQLRFVRITSGTPNITIVGFNQGPQGGYITLGSSGFPTNGNPYNQIKMNTNRFAYGTNPNVLYVGSVIQHELGHCIGFRHTDYMDRSYSCGGSYSNEGASNIGAVLIPGTPSGPDANSWMLACSNGGNRTFNANDKIAMDYLY